VNQAADRDSGLPTALPGERRVLVVPETGPISYYTDAPTGGSARPLLLVHSVNAAASAAEVRPLYERYRRLRPVYAPDLPGYGFSDRSDRDYTPRLMTDAVHAMLAEIARRHGAGPVDAMALSLSSEFLARAAAEKPEAFRSLALVSPTGFSGSRPRYGAPGSTRGLPRLRKALTFPMWRRPLFDLLTSRRSIRFFLRKTWGSKTIDDALWEYDCLTTRLPGAEHAPYCFLTGFLFSADIGRVYESLDLPVWMSHGSRGDFVDYRQKATLKLGARWRFTVYEGGALPYFEYPDRFVRDYDAFMASA
jgi:pimeloyl-ACP methyl ester carboxylesterase